MVQEIGSMDEYKALLEEAGEKLVVLDFHAQWCGPCKMIAPKIQAMAAEFQDVVFAKLDVDEVDDVAQQEQISAMPTFNLYKNKERVDQIVGANEVKIREAVVKHK